MAVEISEKIAEISRTFRKGVLFLRQKSLSEEVEDFR